MIMPYIVQKADEIDSKKMPLDNTAIYASADGIDNFRKKFGSYGHTHAFVHGSKNNVFVVNESGDKSIQAFTEKYVLENL
jgi:hypothetical protein